MRLNDLQVLSGAEIALIHKSSLEVLERTGLVVESAGVLEALAAGGCEVDFAAGRVKFPAKVTEKCIASLPSKIPLYDRDGGEALTLGDGGRYCASGHNAVFMVEDTSGGRRASTVKDVEAFTLVSDALSEVDIVGVPLMPQDAPARTTLLHAIRAILENTKKPIFFSSESDLVNRAAIEMGKAVLGRESLGGCSNLISQLSTTSPLYWERGAAEALHTVAREGVPLAFLPQPITGVTAPYTLAGILTLHNAEVLSGIVISQLINPGTPVIYAAAWTTYEMKQLNVLIGRPESSLLRVAGAQMAHHYGIPSHTTAPDCDANMQDEQSAWEKMLSAVAGLAGGNDLIVNLGMFGTGMSVSLEQLVLDNEMCRITRRFLKGIDVGAETVALDTIAAVGPRGNYLTEDHTLMNLRSGEHAALSVSNASPYDKWRSAGAPDAVANARGKAAGILSGGGKNPLDAARRRKLDAVIEKYERMGNEEL